jgi:hypothetical protein
MFGIVAAAREIAQIQQDRQTVEARWTTSNGREQRRLQASLDSLDDQEQALRSLIAATPPRSRHDAVIQFALGMSEIAAVHGSDGRDETVRLLAAAFGYLARDLGLDPEAYGLGEYVGPHLMAAAVPAPRKPARHP